MLVLGPAGSGRPDDLAGGLVAFAPGLLGYALLAVLSRALYAAGAGRAAATGAALGWLLALLADLVLVPLAGSDRVVTALGVGNSIGMTAAGLLLLRALAAVTGPAGTQGVTRAVVGALGVTAAGGLAGWLVVLGLSAEGVPANLLAGAAAAVAAAAAGLAVTAAIDRPALHAVLALAGRRSGARS